MAVKVKYELPEEIIESIFVRMPTKPLLRLKCLSKHWNRVISDKKLMKLRSWRMIILPVVPLHAIDINVSGNDMGHSMIKLHFPFRITKDKKVCIVGTFDGIVLLVIKDLTNNGDRDVIILYNPFTAAFKIVPNPQSTRYAQNTYGFGYGTTPDDLKILRINIYGTGCGSRPYQVFSLKNDTWSKPFELIGNYYNDFKKSGTFVNGFLYWIVRTLPYIVAFDLKEMVFTKIPVCYGFSYGRLGTFKGRLCKLCQTKSDYEIEVMNEHAFIKSWSTSSSMFNSLPSHFNEFSILYILDEGKLLLSNTHPSNQRMTIYDMFKDSYREVNNVPSLSQKVGLHSVEYVESSISPSHMCSISI